MKRKLGFLFILALCMQAANAQKPDTVIHCKSFQNLEIEMQRHPEINLRMDQIEADIAEWLKHNVNEKAAAQTIYKIPVVVHVLWNASDSSLNLSDEQIKSQINVLNKDFRRRNIDTVKTPLAFKALGADCNIEFLLAIQDNDTNPTSGIIRKQTIVNRFSADANDANYNDIKQNLMGGDNAWPNSKYLNIWIGPMESPLLGYAQFPALGPDSTDGVVISPKYFGDQGIVAPPYNKGRTATHEVGHWFNLRHIWGDDAACAGSDQVSDTPNQETENNQCPSFPALDACTVDSPGVMFMNYMDYSHDSCMNIFSKGQKNRMRAAISSTRSALLTSPGCNQPVDTNPLIQWQNCLGGTSPDIAMSVKPTSDGGSIVAGVAYSFDGDVTGSNGSREFWIVKLSASGKIEWQKCYGGTGLDEAYSITIAYDGGYYVTGYTNSSNGQVSGYNGGYDMWVIRISSAGSLLWQKCLGGSGLDYGTCITATSDSGCIVAGYTNSNDSNVWGNHGGYDYWLVKLSSNGDTLWTKCYGGSNDDFATGIIQDTDTTYVVCGYTASTDKQVTGNHLGPSDYWILRLKSNGAIKWKKCFGGSGRDVANGIRKTKGSGFIIAGHSNSINGDVIGLHGWEDYWVIKLNTQGVLQWQKCLGGSLRDYGKDVYVTDDDSYLVGGYANSANGDVTGNHGNNDYWIVKLSASGSLLWQKCFGGTGDEYAMSVTRSTDGSYMMAGNTGYFNVDGGDISGIHGLDDYWVVKFSQCKASVSASPSLVYCLGVTPSITLTCEEQGNYLWSNGATTKSVVASTSGTYTVTVTSGSCIAVSKPAVVTELPCNVPVSLYLSGLGYYSANVAWQTSSCNVGGYEFGYKRHYLANYTNTYNIAYDSTGSYSAGLSGLLAGKTYDFRVRSVCSGGNFSPWKVITFTTNGPRIAADQEVFQNSLKIYPNPVPDVMTFELQMNTLKAKLTIKNMMGQRLFEKIIFPGYQEYQETIDLRFLPNGVYILTVTGNDDIVISKFIRQ